MAGIGFVLRKLGRRDDLLGVLQSFAHSSLASTGPWVFTVLSLSGIFLIGSQRAAAEELYSFRLIIIYNFAFSLVVSGPLVMLVTRCLADRIYEKDVSEAPGMMLGALGLLFAVQLPVVLYFYFFHFQLAPAARYAAFANFFLISGIWLIGVFLTALKDYRAVSWTFAIGMAAAMLGAAGLASWGAAGMLNGFNLGLGAIFSALAAQVYAEYPYRIERPFAFLRFAREYWEIALGGFVYNLGIWVDKWIMWAAPEAEYLPSGMVSYPGYDSAMFLAYLSIVPSIAVFVFSIETSFFEKYLAFYRGILRHGSLSSIRKNHREILLDLGRSGRNFLIVQGSICVLLALMAPKVFAFMNLGYVQLGIFRMGLLGAFFHAMFLFLSIVLAYFDLRRVVLWLQTLFLAANVVFTLATLQAGFVYYGLGYVMACIVAALAAFLATVHYLEDLPFQTFTRGIVR